MATGIGKMDSSAIVEMEVMDGDDSDYEVNFSDVKRQDTSDTAQTRQHQTNYMEEAKAQVTHNVTTMVLEAGRQRARQLCDVYGKIDILRPYFDVEPHEVRARLLASLIPKKPSNEQVKVPRELYGPSMLVLTMVALLLFQMKMSDHTVQEGTLMGSAFGTCFGYWFSISGLVWMLAYVCNTHITMLQIMSLLGYALFGHCIVLLFGTLFHTGHDHMFFYILWGVLGGLSSLKMISVLMSRTAGQSQKLVLCGIVAALHMMFLLYLHFSYHQVVEELSDIIDRPVEPRMIVQATEKVAGGNHMTVNDFIVMGNDADLNEVPVEDAIRTATKAVERIVVEAANNVTVKDSGSKILAALANNRNNVTAGMVDHRLHRVLNDTKMD